MCVFFLFFWLESSTKITTTTTTAPFMSDSYAGGADADAGVADAAGARDAQYKHEDDEDEDGYDDKHQDGGVKLARSNPANENNDGTAMDKEGGPDAKNTILLRGIVTFSFPPNPTPPFFSCVRACVCVCLRVMPIGRLRL